jgi:tRNA pseudouridine32 synthase / 23S rRNA pseudouridine746 synthase
LTPSGTSQPDRSPDPDHAPHADEALPRVLAEDRWLIAFDKPSGMLSVPGIGPEKQDCLAARAAAARPGARIVHRLDRDTSGVILLARDAETHRELSRQFEARETAKRYLAIGWGHPAADAGTIDLPLRKAAMGSALQIVDHLQGRSATTHWRVLTRLGGPDRTLFELTPITGRSHQLRVHLKELGHPILGDELYAPIEAQNAAPRLCLHALSLRVRHPVENRQLEIVAPPSLPGIAWQPNDG